MHSLLNRDIYEVNKMTTTQKIIYTAKRRTTGLTDITINIYNANQTLVVSGATMTELGNGDYYYDYTPVSGGYHTWYADSVSEPSPLSGTFLSDYTATITVTASTGALATTQELAQFINMEGVVPDRYEIGTARVRESIGLGDGSTSNFFTDYAGLIDDTYEFGHGTTEPSYVALTETTDYSIDKNLGKLTLTSTGLTTVGSRYIYGSYSYVLTSHGIRLTDTQLQYALDQAQAEMENMTYNRWADGTAATPDYAQATNEKHKGKGRWDRDYYLDNFPLPNVSTTLDGDLTAIATTIPVASTNGFLSSGVLSIGTEKITYTGKTTTTFTGCTRGVDDSTGTAASDGDTVYPYCIEMSTSAPNNTIVWTVMQPNIDCDVDLDTGKVHLYRDDLVLDTSSTTTYPPQMVPSRFRATYIWGNSTIPNDVKRCVLMLASKNLIHMTLRKGNVDGIEHGSKIKDLVNIDEEWIKATMDRYRNIKVSNIS